MNGGSTTSSTSSGARWISGKPGISASITPATTSRIAAGICSVRAASATTATTASSATTS